jgi:hypothetical protein
VTFIFTLRGNLLFLPSADGTLAFALVLWSKPFELRSALTGHGDARRMGRLFPKLFGLCVSTGSLASVWFTDVVNRRAARTVGEQKIKIHKLINKLAHAGQLKGLTNLRIMLVLNDPGIWEPRSITLGKLLTSRLVVSFAKRRFFFFCVC